uniref:Serpentine receptor class gamma n=1 Tax=Panagrellus redivivus TaxID=6233 RepID=A0A7E4V0L1_PANRE
MNGTVHPAPVISDFLIYREHVLFPLLFVSIFLGIFLDYVIITQSKSLGTFKYYLLNQTIWAQIFEVLMVVLNSVFLNPYMAGYLGGILRHAANYALTSTFNAVCFSLLVNNISGVVLALLNRYIFTFHPEFRKYLENKYTITAIVTFHAFLYIADVVFYFFALLTRNRFALLQSMKPARHYFILSMNQPLFMLQKPVAKLASSVPSFSMDLSS